MRFVFAILKSVPHLHRRVLVEGGTTMLTMLELAMRGSADVIRTRRYFRRVSDPDKEVVGTPKGLLPHSARNSSDEATQPLLPPPPPEPVESEPASSAAASGSATASATAAAAPSAPVDAMET